MPLFFLADTAQRFVTLYNENRKIQLSFPAGFEYGSVLKTSYFSESRRSCHEIADTRLSAGRAGGDRC